MPFLNLVVLYLLVGHARASAVSETTETTENRYKCLFDEYNMHFGHNYECATGYARALRHFVENLERFNVSHVRSITHLIDILTWTEENVSYSLNPVLHKSIIPSVSPHHRSKYIIKFDSRWRRIAHMIKKIVHRGPLAANSCGSHTPIVYVRANPLPILSKLPPSVDFRELGLVDRARNQGLCGCSWAMVSAGLFEATIRSTREYFKNNGDVDSVFKDPQFNASEQYFLNKSSFGINNCCEGGNYLFLSLDLANNPYMDTVESLENFPFMMKDTYHNPDSIVDDFSRKVSNPFLPGNYVTVSACKTSLIYIYDILSPVWAAFGKAIKIMKSLLAQGIPVVATLHISTLGDEYLRRIAMYNRGILDIPCKHGDRAAIHQVLIIGYGTYSGIDVWVVRNSWGDLWGSHGHFYAAIGKNSMCIEETLYTEIPAYFPLAGYEMYRPYAQRKPADSSTVWSGILERGDEDSLDPDPIEVDLKTEQKAFVIIMATCTILSLAVVLLIAILVVAIRNKRWRVSRPGSQAESQPSVSIVNIRGERGLFR
ncbi:Peptidase, C1A subfamily protein [Giardia duodenalis]|uniref:Peptidase, C1A subfamily protein n=1 Tax=Giardia intestinalis TaxID=5741 RepID=V6TLT2_GIAIN|nr:Peptidase, C1A subfamily protein [Giardia intestinalis]